MEHYCVKCEQKWECESGDGCLHYKRYVDCKGGGGGKCNYPTHKKKPDPCGCDNCEMIRRFGKGNYSGRCICRLCGEGWTKHRGWHCPEKKEWELECGVKVKMMDSHSFEILASTAPGRVGVTEIPSLIKILKEIQNENH